MATNKELEKQVEVLNEKITRLSATNSRVLDEIAILQNNYSNLVKEVSQRFEVVSKRFQV
tara:strand:- start:628 stop:807 length:180 start_codon:yes stop_codon:yes gene_type:complete